MKWKNKKVGLSLLASVILLSSLLGFQYGLSSVPASGPYYLDVPFGTASYYVGKFDNGTTYMVDGDTWQCTWWSSDSSAVLNACIGNLTSGGKIFVKNGEYLISTRWDVAYNDIEIEGESIYGTILKLSDWTNNTLLYITGNNVQVRSLTINGNKLNQNITDNSNDEGSGIVARLCNDTTVENVYIHNTHSRGLVFREVWYGYFRYSKLYNCSLADAYPRYDGMAFNRVNHGEMISVTCEDAYYDSYVIYASAFITMRDSVSLNSGASALAISGATQQVIQEITIDSNHFETWNGQQAIGLTYEANGEFYNIRIINNDLIQTVASADAGIRVATGDKDGVVLDGFWFLNNYINYSYQEGIIIGGHSSHNTTMRNGIIAENYIENSMRDGIRLEGADGLIENILIKDNIVIDNNRNNQESAYYCGIQVTGSNCKNITIKNNEVQENHNAEIYVDSNSGDVVISGNNVLGTDQIIPINATGATVRYNIGFVTENSGTQTCADQEWIAHGLAGTPDVVLVSSGNCTYDSVAIIVNYVHSSMNSTYFQANIYWSNSTAITDDVIWVSWYAEYTP